MPDCDGLDVIRRLRRLYQASRFSRFLEGPGPWIISEKPQHLERLVCYTKPFVMPTLLRTVVTCSLPSVP